MNYQLRLPESLTTSNWSGGTTTQLYIFPEHASYAASDFLVRISTATVTTETSLFTSLPGIKRFLLILDGVLTIEHTGRYQKQLQKFDSDTFLGDWETKGVGKVVDFNVMTSNKVSTQTVAIQLAAQEIFKTSIPSSIDTLLWYIYKGNIQITIDTVTIHIPTGAVFIINPENQSSNITIHSLEETELIQTAILYSSVE